MVIHFNNLDFCMLCGTYDGIQAYIDIEDYKGVKHYYHVCEKCSEMPGNTLRILISNKFDIKDRRLKDVF